jgi:hypothetical protein
LVIVALAVVLLASGPGQAAVLRVKAGEKIQEALDQASAGDTVIVGAGTYKESLRVPGSITLEGEQGWDETHLVGAGAGPVVTCEEKGDRTIAGFTITGGPEEGAAVQVVILSEGHVVLRGCRIADNPGDGIAALVESPLTAFTAEENVIEGNGGRGVVVELSMARARLDANRIRANRNGGVWLAASSEAEFTAARNEVVENESVEGGGFAGEVSGASSARLVANRIVANRARLAAGVGMTVDGATLDLWTNDLHRNRASEAFGGVRLVLTGAAATSLINETVAHNEAPSDGGVSLEVAPEANARVVNGIFWGNSATDLQGASASHSIVGTGQTEGEGNMTTAPKFLDAAKGDYRLCSRSVGVDDGSNDDLPQFLAIDAAGGERRIGERVDCGAYETTPSTLRLTYLDDQIDDLMIARKMSRGLHDILQSRLSYVKGYLRRPTAWNVGTSLGHLRAMTLRIQSATARDLAPDAGKGLLQEITAIRVQVEHCGG